MMNERCQDLDLCEMSDQVWTLICVVGFSFAAHAYRCFNLMYSHDSLMIYQNNVERQISLGRFLQPVYWTLRGQLCAPLLLGLTSTIWLVMAALLIIKILKIRKRVTILLTSGILATGSSLALSYATYVPWIDIYTLALLLCVLGVYLWQRYPRYGFLLGSIPVMISMGLYQAYFQSAVALFMVVLLREILEEERAWKLITDGMKALGTLLCGCALYYALMQIVLRVTAVGAAGGYNGISRLGSGGMTLKYLCFMIMKAYTYVLDEIVRPVNYNPYQIVSVANILLLLLTGAGLIRIIRRERISGVRLLLMIILLGAMPFGVNVVYFISKGVEHPLMTYSFCFGYVLVLMLLEMYMEPAPKRGWMRWAVWVPVLLVIWNSIVFANQLYLKKGLEEQATLSCMTRMVQRIEDADGYMVNETPVVLIGQLEHSYLAQAREGFQEEYGVGMGRNFAVTDYESYEDYFELVLGYPIRLLSEEESERYARMDEVRQMPDFPAKASIDYVGDVLVVKLSNDL